MQRACLLLALTFLPVLFTPAVAYPQWRAGKPYELAVVVRFVDSPLMTPAFQDSVTLLAEDQLQNLFGPLARLQVSSGVDKGHWLIRKIAGAGLQQATLSFDQFKGTLPQKVFLFEVDHRNNLYVVRWRQLDTELQYISPVYSRTTPDRRWVAKALCQAVQSDFAPVARLQAIATAPAQRRLHFQGAAWPQHLQKFLHDGAVLLPFKEQPGNSDGVQFKPLNRTVLKLTRGVADPAVADVASDLTAPFRQTARILGYRALRLKTTPGFVRVRLIDADTGFAVTTWSVKGSGTGFTGVNDGEFFGPVDAAGFRTSAVRYNGLAYIRLLDGGVSAVNMPVPVTGPLEEITVKLRVDAASREKSEVLRAAQYLTQDLRALRTGIDGNYKAANKLLIEKKYEQARDRFVALGAAVRAQLTRAGTDLHNIRQAAAAIKGGAGQAVDLRIAAAQNGLEVLQGDEASINRSTRSLSQTIQEITNENLAHNLIEGSAQAIQAGNIEEGITLLEQALATFPGRPGVAQRIRHLKNTWQIKSPAHAAARKFVRETWAKINVATVGVHLPQAGREFAVLEAVGDYLTLAEMRKTGVATVVDLAQLVEQAAVSEPESLAKYQALTQQLQKLNEQVIAAETKFRSAATQLPASEVPSTPPPASAAAPTTATTPAAADKPAATAPQPGPGTVAPAAAGEAAGGAPALPDLPALPGFEEEEEP